MKPILAIVLLLGLAACGKPEQPAPAPSVEATAVPAVEPVSVAAPPAPVSVSTPVPLTPEIQAAPPRPTPPVTMPAPGPRETAPLATVPAATVPPSPAPVAASAPDPGAGRQAYQQACAFCHDKGVAGAPRLGDAAAWSARTAQGMETLYASAIRGKGAMPAKGGNPSLSDDAVKAAVDYLVAGSR